MSVRELRLEQLWLVWSRHVGRDQRCWLRQPSRRRVLLPAAPQRKAVVCVAGPQGVSVFQQLLLLWFDRRPLDNWPETWAFVRRKLGPCCEHGRPSSWFRQLDRVPWRIFLRHTTSTRNLRPRQFCSSQPHHSVRQQQLDSLRGRPVPQCWYVQPVSRELQLVGWEPEQDRLQVRPRLVWA